MKNRFVIFLIVMMWAAASYGQTPTYRAVPTDGPLQVICHHDHDIEPLFIRPGKHHSILRQAPLSEFVVVYNGLDEEQKQAFEYALSLLAEIFPSSRPINVFAQTADLTGSTIASAGPTEIFELFLPNLPPNTIYPIALAEKLLDQELNTASNFDIVVNINENITDFYYDFNNPEGIGNKLDFVTVILHELCHGLGFTSSTAVVSGRGLIAFPNNGALVSSIYDKQLETGNKVSLVTGLENESFELGSALEGGDVFMGSRFFKAISPNNLPKIFAPSNFNGGSSISHLDLVTFSNTPNALMSPSISRNTVIHDLGLSKDILLDLGWSYSDIRRISETYSEDVNTDFEVEVALQSDFGIDSSSFKMFYFEGAFSVAKLNNLPMIFDAESGTFKAILPAAGQAAQINYYFTALDDRSLSVTSPFDAPNNFFTFYYGPDTIAPTLTHIPVDIVDANQRSFPLAVTGTDIYSGIDSVLAIIEVVGKALDTLLMLEGDQLFGETSYNTEYFLPGELDTTDILRYHFIANDIAASNNTGRLPEDGFFEITINPPILPVLSYVNDFETPTSDFDGESFQEALVAGFLDHALHSPHPYGQAADMGLRSFDIIHQLKLPIVVLDKSRSFISLDEVVLIEPGDNGSVFGTEDFFDYAVIEAKRFNTNEDWIAMVDGYDSRDNEAWLTAYNDSFDPCPSISNSPDCISTATGADDLLINRRFNIADNPAFAEGDTILIRFRLFSDPAAYGWGWAIDNLMIQADINTSIPSFEEGEVLVFPNPTENGKISIIQKSPGNVTRLTYTIYDLQGKLIQQGGLYQDRTLVQLPQIGAGIYVLHLTDGHRVTTKKIIAQPH